MDRCPTRQTLRRLLAEELSDAERSGVELHVEQCDGCQDALSELTGSGAEAARVASLVQPRPPADADTDAFFAKLREISPDISSEVSANISAAPGDEEFPADPPPPPPPAHPHPPEGYRLLEQIGTGASGVVYRALHLELNRLVALKVFVAGGHMSPQVRQRFRTEARAIARLRHPNIVQIYDVGEFQQRPYLSLELVEGQNLARWAGGKPRQPIEAAQILAALASAVEYAHQQGVVHRDLKPSNVLLNHRDREPGQWEVKITDFGIAKMLPLADATSQPMTETGELLGTPAYMAPEQVRGHSDQITPATDVHALGAILYELLTGRPPFQGATSFDTMMQAAHQEPVSVHLLVPGVPRDLVTICMKCLEKDPVKRYPTANALDADLTRFLHHLPILARPISSFGQLLRWMRRRKRLAGALVGSALLAIFFLIGLLISLAYFHRMEQQQRELAGEREKERQMAVSAEQSQSALRQTAQRESAELVKNAYFDQMNLAANAVNSPSGIGQVIGWLSPWTDRGPDLRDWEWFYLLGLCHRDVLTITGHEHQVQTVAWSSNGRQLASASSDGTVRLWDATDGREIRRLCRDAGDIRCAAWRPDSLRIAAVDWNGTLHVWDAGSGNQLLAIPNCGVHPATVAWSPDGKRLATGGYEDNAKIWDAATGALQRVLPSQAKEIHSVAWSPDGQRLATGCADQAIRIWDTRDGQLLRTITGPFNQVNSVAWNPGGTLLAAANNDHTVVLWDPDTGGAVRVLRGHSMGVSWVAWNPDGTQLVTASDDQTIKFWSPGSGEERFTLRGHTRRVACVAWNPAGTQIVSCGGDGTIKVWDAATGPEFTGLATPGEGVYAMAWSPDSSRIASGGDDQRIYLWDIATGAQRIIPPLNDGQLRALAWSRDGRLASAGQNHLIQIWDGNTSRLLQSFPAEDPRVNSLAWSPDGRRLASADSSPLIRIWDPTAGRRIATLQGHQANVYCIAWSGDGKRLASVSSDHTTRIWDAQSRKQQLLIANSDEIDTLAWSPDGRQIATGGDDQAVTLWDASTGDLVNTFRGHTANVTALAWNPDGARLASASDDQTVKLWDISTGHETLTLDCHVGLVKTVAWSPDGLILAAGGDVGMVRFYDATPGYIASHSRQFLPMLDRKIACEPPNPADLRLRAQFAASLADQNRSAKAVGP